MTGECIKHKDLAELFLSPERLHRFFDYAGNVKTDLAMEGFKNLRLLLTVHKKIISSFLKQNFDLIFKHNFSNLLKSENYFTVTKTLILLYDILISYENKQVLAKYMNELPLLIQIMELLRSKQLNLQNSAYNIFKLFLGNDKKSEEIERVLYNNKTVLEDFLKRFENDGLIFLFLIFFDNFFR
ncbi:Calcium-binding protein 39-like, variant 2 [Bonamia ostreae]